VFFFVAGGAGGSDDSAKAKVNKGNSYNTTGVMSSTFRINVIQARTQGSVEPPFQFKIDRACTDRWQGQIC
jgi:uncharacterized Zn finger protein